LQKRKAISLYNRRELSVRYMRSLPRGKYDFICNPILRKTDRSSSVIISWSSDGLIGTMDASIFASNFSALDIFAWA